MTLFWGPKKSSNSKESSEDFTIIFWTISAFSPQNKGFQWELTPRSSPELRQRLGRTSPLKYLFWCQLFRPRIALQNAGRCWSRGSAERIWGELFILLRQILGKLPENFSANFSAPNFFCELFSLVFCRVSGPSKKFTPKIHRHSSPSSLSWAQMFFTAIFCLQGRPKDARNYRSTWRLELFKQTTWASWDVVGVGQPNLNDARSCRKNLSHQVLDVAFPQVHLLDNIFGDNTPPSLKKITYAKKFLRNYFRGDCDGFA